MDWRTTTTGSFMFNEPDETDEPVVTTSHLKWLAEALLVLAAVAAVAHYF